MRSPHLLGALAGLAGLAPFGCAQNSMYRWGGYDQALYDHYKNPQKRDEFVAKLSGIIQQAEATGGLVPPGCYADGSPWQPESSPSSPFRRDGLRSANQ